MFVGLRERLSIKRTSWLRRGPTIFQSRFARLGHLLSLYSKSDAASETLLYVKVSELRVEGTLTESEQRWIDRLKDLVELRGLVFGSPLTGKKGLRQGFAFCQETRNVYPIRGEDVESSAEDFSLQDITESAIVVADRYWKLYDACRGEFPDLAKVARRLYSDVFNETFDASKSRVKLELLTDMMQKDAGVPFLILNLVRKGNYLKARQITQSLLAGTEDMDEDIRSAVYWISEIYWFTKERKAPIADHESSIRYLYHLCFTNPERAGFLEIDSQFFSEFETVNELAREGFLFKENLIERLLSLWKDYDRTFDGVFQSILESIAQRKSKIYDQRENWERFWRVESDNFSRDYLYVVEGNIYYAGGHFADARICYEKALEINPTLRSALLNAVFCYARLGKAEPHQAIVQRVIEETSLLPSSLYVIGNSYLLLGDSEQAEAYYNELKGYPGWERKTDYYKSTFCFENGLFEKALHYARLAHTANPEDGSVRYHLSLCYNAVGEKNQALDLVKTVNEAPRWLDYYRFTLERDAGHDHEASATLLSIPRDYFEDPDELQAAVDFAKGRRDLVLLRHLKARG